MVKRSLVVRCDVGSIPPDEPIELLRYVPSCLWVGADKRSLAANRKD